MRLPDPQTGGQFVQSPPGTYIANCYRFIDLGTQADTFKGQPKNQHKVVIAWELSDEFMDDGKPFVISRKYTWSMSDKAHLRHHLESWRGKAFGDADFTGPNAFDIKNILGKPCILTIVQDESGGKTYSNVAGVSKMMRGVQAAPLQNKLTYLSLMPDEFDKEAFESLSDYYKGEIVKSPEYAALFNRSDDQQQYDDGRAAGYPDDIPF